MPLFTQYKSQEALKLKVYWMGLFMDVRILAYMRIYKISICQGRWTSQNLDDQSLAADLLSDLIQFNGGEELACNFQYFQN